MTFNVKCFVDELSYKDQEDLLTELMRQDRIAIHIEKDETTHGVGDVYDNSNVDCTFGEDEILTILLVTN